MNILGISCFYHDSAACLVRDGEIIAAVQEERFTRAQKMVVDADYYCAFIIGAFDILYTK